MVPTDQDEPFQPRSPGPAARERRNELAAQFIPSGSRVLCWISPVTTYLSSGSCHPDVIISAAIRPCTTRNRSAITSRSVNWRPIPLTTLTSSQCWAYWNICRMQRRFFARLRSSNRDIVLSYCPTDLSGPIDRKSSGWVTHFGFLDLAELFYRHGFRIEATISI